MNLNITVQSATFEKSVVTIESDNRRPINRLALRTLALQELAESLGLPFKPSEFFDATGYSVRDNDQWVTESRDVDGGGRVLTLTITVPTPEQKEAKLRREGGTIPLADGSMGFVFPSRRP